MDLGHEAPDRCNFLGRKHDDLRVGPSVLDRAHRWNTDDAVA